MSAELEQVQRAIRADLPQQVVTVRLMIDLQRLDGIRQTMEDLARMFAAIGPVEEESIDKPTEASPALEAIIQETLRARLAGRDDRSRDPEIDIF